MVVFDPPGRGDGARRSAAGVETDGLGHRRLVHQSPLGFALRGERAAGKTLACSIDLERELEKNPVARQMRHSLLDYMAGEKFQPQVELKPEQVQGLFAQPSAIERLGGRVAGVDGFEPDYESQKRSTVILPLSGTRLGGRKARLSARDSAGVRRADSAQRRDDPLPPGRKPQRLDQGLFASVSADGKDWSQPVAEGTFTRDAKLKTVLFAAPVRGEVPPDNRQIRLRHRPLRLACRIGCDSGKVITLPPPLLLPPSSFPPAPFCGIIDRMKDTEKNPKTPETASIRPPRC